MKPVPGNDAHAAADDSATDLAPKPLDFVDLKSQQDRIRPQLERNIQRVLQHGRYIMGPEVQELEERLAAYVGVAHCIGVSSGTDALLVAMMALGIGPGDEVITTPFSFIATGETIALIGARPVFVDIDPRTYNLDPHLIDAAITPRTRAIMPVSLYGQCADMDVVDAIADRHGVPVIEDAAQSFGASYKERRSCGLSAIGCTSFFPSKPLGGYGDGGACFTDDAALAKAMREIRAHGQDRRYHHPRIGINGRLDTLQAAILLAKLEVFDDEVAARERIGQAYSERFLARGARTTAAADGGLLVPHIEPFNRSVFAQYTLQVPARDRVQERLAQAGIPTAVHYPVPLNAQPVFAKIGDATDTPVSLALSRRVVSLPMHPYLSPGQVDEIAALVTRATRESSGPAE